MGRKVILSPRAIEDLGEIVRYIARDSPDRALAFGNQLLDRVQQIADFPESGRAVPEYDNPVAREIIFRNYRIVYRLNPKGNTVEVSRFWHAARGVPEM